jgi:hypothetical protein
LVILHLVGFCCFSSVKDQKVAAIECLKNVVPFFYPHSFIPVVFSAPIVVVAFQAIVGARPKECSESPKNQH